MSGAFRATAEGGGGGVVIRYAQSFSGAASVLVSHNLGYKPDVNIQDVAGNQMVGLISHTSVSEFTVTFNVPLTGTIHYT